jgi:hypothetical protein
MHTVESSDVQAMSQWLLTNHEFPFTSSCILRGLHPQAPHVIKHLHISPIAVSITSCAIGFPYKFAAVEFIEEHHK